MNDIRLGQSEDITAPEENPRLVKRLERLGRTRIELVTKIAQLWANKENEPVLRADFMLRVKPEGMPRVHADEMMLFSSVDRFFESEAMKMTEKFERRYAGRRLVLEFLLYPYQQGCKKLIPDLVLDSLNPVTQNVSVPSSVAAEQPALQLQPAPVPLDAPVQIDAHAPRQDVVIETAEKVKKKVLAASVRGGDETVSVPKTHESTTRLLEQLKAILRAEKKVRGESDETDDGFMDMPISFHHADWRVNSRSTVMRKIAGVFAVNNINTPRDLMNMLGNANPSEKDWNLFIERMNLFMTRGQKLGGGSVYDLCEWMRRHGLIPPVFRE